VNSKASSKFWKAYRELPVEVQRIAAKQYHLWQRDTSHPSLQFKRVQNYWSCRVTDSYRALAIVDGETAIWFWIGPHAEYDRLIQRKR